MTLYRADGWVKSVQGQAIAGAQVYICLQPADSSFLPPVPLASIFADSAGLVPITQPIFSDNFGHYDYYAASGVPYTEVVVNNAFVQASYPDQVPMGATIGILGSVISVFGRTGTVVAANNDYSFSQISGSLALGQIPTGGSSSTFLRGDGVWATPAGGGSVTSVFGRTGAVVAASNDYSFSQLSGVLALGQIPAGGSSSTFLRGDGTWSTPGGGGTVTSVALTTPGIFSVAGSPVTTSGTLAVSLATQTSNTVWAGPTSGSAANPAFRALVSTDIPNPTINAQTGSYTAVLGDANNIVTMNVGSANNFTVPPNASVAFTTGTVLTIIQLGAGQTTVVAGAGVTINTPTSLTARAQFSTVSVVKTGSDTWEAAGDYTLSGSSADFVKISETILGSAAASISFSSIPATYRNLKLTLTGASSNTNGNVYIQFNGDTATNYTSSGFFAGSSTGQGTTANTAHPIVATIALSTAVSGQPGVTDLMIYDYARTVWFKAMTSESHKLDNSSTGVVLIQSGTWFSTAAINSILLGIDSGGNFITGTVATLYGLK